MGKTISYRGQLPVGKQQEINLKTNKGKIGYKIIKFQIMSETPGTHNIELIGQIFRKDQTGSISGEVNFDNDDLLAAAFINFPSGGDYVIFDSSIINQNIFVTMIDASGNTVPGNYYIEVETMELSDVQATQLTLKNIKTITS